MIVVGVSNRKIRTQKRGKPINKAQALRIARMTAPMWLSLGLGVGSMGLSAEAAWKDPTADNIEDLAWDTANLTADALSLIPFLALPMEGVQKTLGLAHLTRSYTRTQQAKEDLENLEIK